jgi:hypothetical protein
VVVTHHSFPALTLSMILGVVLYNMLLRDSNLFAALESLVQETRESASTSRFIRSSVSVLTRIERNPDDTTEQISQPSNSRMPESA